MLFIVRTIKISNIYDNHKFLTSIVLTNIVIIMVKNSKKIYPSFCLQSLLLSLSTAALPEACGRSKSTQGGGPHHTGHTETGTAFCIFGRLRAVASFWSGGFPGPAWSPPYSSCLQTGPPLSGECWHQMCQNASWQSSPQPAAWIPGGEFPLASSRQFSFFSSPWPAPCARCS